MYLNKPMGLELIGAQEASIKAMIRCLVNGAIVGKGTARGVLLADEQGTGKTPCSIVTANTMAYQRILVIAPAALRDNWDREITKWQTLGHPIYHLTSENLGLFKPKFLANLGCGWVIVNYDILHKYPGLNLQPWDLIIADEAIAVKNPTARRSAAMFGGKYGKKYYRPIPAKKYLLLSGTPMPNRVEEISMLIEVLDPDNWEFSKLLADYYGEGTQADDTRRVDGEPHNLPLLQQRLRETIMVRTLLKDALPDIPDPWQDEIEVACDNEEWFGQQLAWRKKLLAMLYNAPIKERRGLQAKLSGLDERLRQATGRAETKTEAVIEYLLEQDEKVVVFAYHQDLIEDHYAVKLRQAGRKVLTLTGNNTKDTQALVDQFQNDPDTQYFILSTKVGGQGITLTASHHVVFAELDWSPAVLEQAFMRCHRFGQKHRVEIKYFVMDCSMDQLMMASVARKLGISRQALNKVPAE